MTTIPFTLSPPAWIFATANPTHVVASLDYLSTAIDGTDCWWQYVSWYNGNQPPVPVAPPTCGVACNYVPPSTPPATSIPEPATYLLLCIGFLTVAGARLLGQRFHRAHLGQIFLLRPSRRPSPAPRTD